MTLDPILSVALVILLAVMLAGAWWLTRERQPKVEQGQKTLDSLGLPEKD